MVPMGAFAVTKLPAVLVIGGDEDDIIPLRQGRAFAAMLSGLFSKSSRVPATIFTTNSARVVREFLDDPHVPPTRLRPTAIVATLRPHFGSRHREREIER